MAPKLRRLSPGVYFDPVMGELHLDIPEMLAEHGYADTPENREVLIDAARTMLTKQFPNAECVVED